MQFWLDRNFYFTFDSRTERGLPRVESAVRIRVPLYWRTKRISSALLRLDTVTGIQPEPGFPSRRIETARGLFYWEKMEDFSLYFFKKNGIFEASVFAQNQEDSITLLNKYLSSVNEAFGYFFSSVSRSDIYSASADTPDGAIVGVHEFILQSRGENFLTLNLMAQRNLAIYGFCDETSARLSKDGECEVVFSISRQAFDLITSKKSLSFLYVTDKVQFVDTENHRKGIK
jgi:hypothetical protein